MTRAIGFIIPGVILLAAFSVQAKSRLYVDFSASGANDGLSWTDAYSGQFGLSNAITYANSHPSVMEIWVANGTYRAGGLGTFQLSINVEVYGGFAGGETLLSQRNITTNLAILSGDVLGNDTPGFGNVSDNEANVVNISSNNPVLDGFRITGGYADGSGALGRGAGILITGGSPIIRNCTIHTNWASIRGAGIDCEGGGTPIVRDTLIAYNETSGTGGGGGFGNGNCAPTISKCIFLENVAGGGIGGGGISVEGGDVVVAHSFFQNNEALAGGTGGAIVVYGSRTLTVNNCEFSGNAAVSNGDGIYSVGSFTIVNSTFANHVGPAISVNSLVGSHTVRNCVLWGNGSPFELLVGSPSVFFSIVEGGWGGAGLNNLNADPLYMNTAAGDFRLKANSPAVDAGNNVFVPADVGDVDNDGDTAEIIPLALGGIGRFEDNPYVADTGGGTAPIVDMGAYEVRGFNILYVNENAPEGGGDWVSAYTKLQDALTESESSASAQIWVADGTYYPDEGVGFTPGDRAATFQLRDHVEIYGGFAGGETMLSERNVFANYAFLSGDLNGDDMPNFMNYGENSYHVVTASGTDDTARLDAFQVVHGNADGPAMNQTNGAGVFANDGSPFFSRVTFADNRADNNGGGMYLKGNSGPVLEFCQFNGNLADNWGGGLMVQDALSTPNIYYCAFNGNSANSRGGGLAAEGSDFTMTGGSMANNSSTSGGGAVYLAGMSAPLFDFVDFNSNTVFSTGGAIFVDDANLRAYRCTFVDNGGSEGSSGGAININGTADIINCRFLQNGAEFGGAIYDSAALFGLTTVVNSTFSGNSAENGGAFFGQFGNGELTISNCSFSDNHANADGGGVAFEDTILLSLGHNFSRHKLRQVIPVAFGFEENLGETSQRGGPDIFISNSILWQNSDQSGVTGQAQIFEGTATPFVSYCDVQGGWSGNGSNNISADPLFVDADGMDNIVGTVDDDLRLQFGSLCIDAGSNSAVPADSLDLDNDKDVDEPTPIDLDGQERFDDDPFVNDSGEGSPPIVDMGAYERITSILFVDADATGSDDGSSWENAFVHLQKALSVASGTPGEYDAIWVAEGTYRPDLGPGLIPGDRTARFQLLNGVTIYGGFSGNETSLDQRDTTNYATILSGDLLGNDAPVACTQDSPDCDSFGELCINGFCIIADNNNENSYHVVSGGGTDATAILNGFTITAGNADGVGADALGGGMRNLSGSPTVQQCNFVGNQAYSTANPAGSVGGGMYNGLDSPNVSSCNFIGNYSYAAGGLAIVQANGIISNCTFRNNKSASGAGGMLIQAANPMIASCTFVGNSTGEGGGMVVQLNSSPTIANCSFSGNSAVTQGGGIYNTSTGAVTIVNCIFSGNSAGSGGAGMININMSSNPIVTNCTFHGNSAGVDGGGFLNFSGGSPTLTNCILWNNSDAGGMDSSAQIHTVGGSPTVNYSIVQGGWTGMGTNNLNTDPLLMDADGADDVAGTEDDDLHLQPGSPAIDSANTPALPQDVNDADGDGNTSERYPFDLADNPRILDDPATTDTGVPGSNVVDMGAYELFSDCNVNGIPDVCDISCGMATGPCDIPGCGGSQDCDWEGKGSNGVPDECDIANCSGFFLCDDCNLNGVPDACDIASMTSEDMNPADGIPDECSQFGAGCVADDDWSCFDNWNIPGNVYPDNTGPVTYSVTLDATDDVFLDVDVTIDSLRMIEDSVLRVTQIGSPGDLTIVQPGGLLLESTLRVANNRLIDVQTGPVVVRDGGSYARLAAAPDGSVSAQLNSAGLRIYSGGSVMLSDTMTLNVNGDVLLDGLCTIGCTRRGGKTPPILVIPLEAGGSINGNLDMYGPVNVAYSSTIPLSLFGNFNNYCTTPETFDFSHGTVLLNGTAPQSFEVGGEDIGPTLDGFYRPAGMHTNFSMGVIDIAAGGGRIVRFENTFGNITSSAPCAEALYVHTLILREGANVTLANCKLYYETLNNQGGIVTSVGCGELVPIADCTADAHCNDGTACFFDECVAGTCNYTPVDFGNVDGSGPVDVDDIVCVLNAFADFNACPNADISNCRPSGVIDVDDISSVLDAFAGIDPCQCHQ